MNKDEIKKLLDKTDIYVLDEINILEYIDELEQIKKDYIKSLDKLDVLENRNNKAIEELKLLREKYFRKCIAGSSEDLSNIIDILRGKDNE